MEEVCVIDKPLYTEKLLKQVTVAGCRNLIPSICFAMNCLAAEIARE